VQCGRFPEAGIHQTCELYRKRKQTTSKSRTAAAGGALGANFMKNPFIEMRLLLIFGVVITLLAQCTPKNEDINDIIISPILLTAINNTIDHVDSLTITNPTYGEIMSFIITFKEIDNKCFVIIEGDFNYYDSKAMNGYFIYKRKAVSIYNAKEKCGIELINLKYLRQGKINGLTDFDHKQFDEAIKLNQEPPPPPPPREPYFRKYLIVSKNEFKLIDFYGKK
jgi:hypothetical protein